MARKNQTPKKKKMSLPACMWRRKFRLLLLAAVVAGVVALFSVTEALSAVTGYIKLDFESAHQGITPSGTRFNIYDIKSEAVLGEALRMTGLEDRMTWRALGEQLSVSPSRTQSVSKRYIATEYTATLAWPEKIDGVDGQSMLDVIFRLYYETFLRQSGLGHAQLEADWTLLDGMEYMEIGDYVKSRTDILRQFLQNRIDSSSGYSSEDPALNFRALLTTVETFQTVYVNKFTALVTQRRLFKDAQAYETKLTYQRMLVDQSYQLSRAQFTIREEVLADYEESLIAIVMVPTYYADSGLYMSRTQIGIDTLTKEAEKYSQIAQKQALKLAQIEKSLSAVRQAQADASGKADTLLDNITRQFDDLVTRIRIADDAYIEYTARDYVSFSGQNIGIKSAYGLKMALIFSAGSVLLAGLLFWLYDWRMTMPHRSKARARAEGGEQA